jgi:hypothetical protein
MQLIEIEQKAIRAEKIGATISLEYNGIPRLVIPVAYGWTRGKANKPSRLMLMCYMLDGGEHKIRVYEFLKISNMEVELAGTALACTEWRRQDLTPIFHDLMWKAPKQFIKVD